MIAFLALRLAGFLAIPFGYWLSDLLSYDQAGKSAFMGGLVILALSAWRGARPAHDRTAPIFLELAIALPFLLILAFEAFLRDFFGVAHDDAIVTEALFNSNVAEASEFFLQNGRGILKHLILLGVALSWFGITVWASARSRRGTVSVAGLTHANQRRRIRSWPAMVFGGLFLLAHFNPTMRNADPLLYFPLRYTKWHTRLEHTQQLQMQLAKTQDDPNLMSMGYVGAGNQTVVFVLGESTTRLNWSLYGYPRQTTPKLEEIAAEIVKFDDVISGYPGTEGSLKQIFTPATIGQPDLWMTQPDILTMAKRSGYKTFWLTNQGTRSGFAAILASHADVVEFTNKGGSRGEGSYDEVLLPVYQRALDDPAPRKFIVLHMLGAHPAYNFRYPKDFALYDFTSDVVTRQLRAQGRGLWAIELRNEYDDAMVYMDHMLRSILDMTRGHATGKRVAWLFAPDHGEDVAHYTDFVGHNHRVPAMYEVPMLYWASGGIGSGAIDPEILRKRPYELDVMDHTLLGQLGLRGNYYNPGNDIFSTEFHPAARIVNGQPYLPGIQR